MFANYSFNITSLNLNLLASSQSANFYDNAYATIDRVVYQDVASFLYTYGGRSFKTDFVGREFSVANGVVTGGTVTGIFEQVWTGSKWVYSWGVSDISVPAISVANAVFSPTITDDFKLISQALSGNNEMRMSESADTIQGFAGNDKIYGNGGNDSISGDAGADTLLGGAGDDTINGGANNDLLTGNSGQDRLSGADGTDTFIWLAATDTGSSERVADIVFDFMIGQDKVSLAAIDASSLQKGNNSFTWIGTSNFSTNAFGEVRYQKFDNTGTANDYTLVFLDTDSDTAAEGVIKLIGLKNLSASDFLL